MNLALWVLLLATAMCWGLAKITQPRAGQVFNVVAVVLLGAALVVLLLAGAPQFPISR